MEIVRIGVLAGFLTVCSVLDVRFRHLPVRFLLAGVILGTMLEFAENGMGMRMLWNLMPGAFLLLIHFAAPEQLGAGDGWMLMGGGALAGWDMGLLLLEGGLLLLFPAAFFRAVIRKKRKEELPFAPFMLASCLCSLVFLKCLNGRV